MIDRADVAVAVLAYLKERATEDYLEGKRATRGFREQALKAFADDPGLDGLEYEHGGDETDAAVFTALGMFRRTFYWMMRAGMLDAMLAHSHAQGQPTQP